MKLLRFDMLAPAILAGAAVYMLIAWVGGQNPFQLTTACANAVAAVYMWLTVRAARQLKALSASERELAATICGRIAADADSEPAREALKAAAHQIRQPRRPN